MAGKLCIVCCRDFPETEVIPSENYSSKKLEELFKFCALAVDESASKEKLRSVLKNFDDCLAARDISVCEHCDILLNGAVSIRELERSHEAALKEMRKKLDDLTERINGTILRSNDGNIMYHMYESGGVDETFQGDFNTVCGIRKWMKLVGKFLKGRQGSQNFDNANGPSTSTDPGETMKPPEAQVVDLDEMGGKEISGEAGEVIKYVENKGMSIEADICMQGEEEDDIHGRNSVQERLSSSEEEGHGNMFCGNDELLSDPRLEGYNIADRNMERYQNIYTRKRKIHERNLNTFCFSESTMGEGFFVNPSSAPLNGLLEVKIEVEVEESNVFNESGADDNPAAYNSGPLLEVKRENTEDDAKEEISNLTIQSVYTVAESDTRKWSGAGETEPETDQVDDDDLSGLKE